MLYTTHTKCMQIHAMVKNIEDRQDVLLEFAFVRSVSFSRKSRNVVFAFRVKQNWFK